MKKLNLLEGRIVPLLIKLTLPIIGTSFLEMAYALIDMLWIGKACVLYCGSWCSRYV